MKNLFANNKITAPLAEQMRPKSFNEVIGQGHLTADNNIIARMLNSHQFSSIILWGPPGCGKTTIARLLAENSGCEMENISAVTSGVVELKKIFDKASMCFKDGVRTLLFVDEIHRFNRSQQDVFLPFVENGTILLVGATTENPSFELNSALLSRCRVLVLKRLDSEAMQQLLKRAEEFMGRKLNLPDEVFLALIAMADGDGRYFLGLLEDLFNFDNKIPLTIENITKILQARAPIYDKHQESHYNLISALHKSLRGSDVDAALYWLHRMLIGGESPLYIIRRLVRFAVEDIGLADPEALH
ncbi:MAG: replication-associated recombination protein A, partial [Pseudomonadota bacterium]